MLSTNLIVSSHGDVTVAMIDELLSAIPANSCEIVVGSTWRMGNLVHSPFFNNVDGIHQEEYLTSTLRLDYDFTIKDYRLSRLTYFEELLFGLLEKHNDDVDVVTEICRKAVIQYAALHNLLLPNDTCSTYGIKVATNPNYDELLHYQQLIRQPLDKILQEQRDQVDIDTIDFDVAVELANPKSPIYQYSLIKYCLSDYLPELTDVIECGSGEVSDISILDSRTIFNNHVLLNLKMWLASPFENTFDVLWFDGVKYQSSDFHNRAIVMEDMVGELERDIFQRTKKTSLTWDLFISEILRYRLVELKIVSTVLDRWYDAN